MKYKMKKLLVLLMTLVLLLTAIPFGGIVPAYANTGANPVFSLDSTVVKKGSTFYLNLYAENLNDCLGGAVFIKYDNAAFDFVRDTGAGEISQPSNVDILVEKTYPDSKENTDIACVFVSERSFSSDAFLLAQFELFCKEEAELNKNYAFEVEVDHVYLMQGGSPVNLASASTKQDGSARPVQFSSSKDIFKYKEDRGSIIITGLNGFDPNIEVPEEIDGMLVAAIEEKAFYNNSFLTNVILPSSLVSIGTSAFDGCYNLERIDVLVKEGVVSSFSSDSSGVLYGLVTGEGDQIIGKTLVCYPPASKQAIFYTEMIIELPKRAFAGSQHLKTILIGDMMDKIDNEAFASLTNLTSINVNSQNKKFFSEKGILYSKDKKKLIKYPQSKVGESFEISAAVTEITPYSFEGVRYLKTITVNAGNTPFSAVSGVLFSRDRKKLIFYPGGKTDSKYAIPTTVTVIDNMAFSSNRHIKNLEIPKSVLTIGDNFNNLFEPAGIGARPKGSWTVWIHAGSPAENYLKSQAANLEYKYFPPTLQQSTVDVSFLDKEDVTVKINLNGHKFKNVTGQNAANYSFSGDTLTIKKEYLTSIRIEENVGKVFVWTLNFESGDQLRLNLRVVSSGPVEPEYTLGDVNNDGRITAVDARTTLRFSASLVTLTETQQLAADVNKDGRVTATDARRILRVSASLDTFDR